MSTFVKITYEKALTQWNDFANNSTVPSFYLNPSLFNFYLDHFHWQPYFILVVSNAKPWAFLTLVYTNKAWVSIPHFTYGGLLPINMKGPNGFSFKQLIQDIIKYKIKAGNYEYNLECVLKNNAKEIKFKYFFRSINNLGGQFHETNKITSIIKLRGSKEGFYLSLNSNLRRKINKSLNNGLCLKMGGEELLKDFYNIYTLNIKRLSSIAYTFSFFVDLIEYYRDIKLFVAYIDGTAVGAALLMYSNNFFENAFFATNSNYKKYYVSDFLHWKMIEFAFDQSADENEFIYSLGRSTKNSSVHVYKSHWPVVDLPLYISSNIRDKKNNLVFRSLMPLIPSSLRLYLGSKLIDHIY